MGDTTVRPRDITAALRRLNPHSAAGGVETRNGGQPGEFLATISLDYAQHLGVNGADGGGQAGLTISRALGHRVHITSWRGLRPCQGRGYRVEVTLRLHATARAEAAATLDAYPADQAGRVLDEAEKFPGSWAYTADRRRAVVFHMPGGTWEAADTAETEERIAAYARRRGQMLRAHGGTP
jgi:hypothetical protein